MVGIAFILKDVGPHTLELWKVYINLRSHDEHSRNNIRLESLGDIEKLESWETILHYWPHQPPNDCLHIIVKASTLKRKRDDPSWSSSDVALNLSTNHAISDISRKLFDLWTKPAKWDLQHLKEYLEKPLDPYWKILLPHAEWRALLVTESIPAHACSAEDLELLFKQSEDETVVCNSKPVEACNHAESSKPERYCNFACFILG